jgi:hypothetical protein
MGIISSFSSSMLPSNLYRSLKLTNKPNSKSSVNDSGMSQSRVVNKIGMIFLDIQSSVIEMGMSFVRSSLCSAKNCAKKLIPQTSK